MVILPQGQPLGNGAVKTVIQSAGGVQADHRQAVDGEQAEVQPFAHYGGLGQQQGGAQQGQHGPRPVGDGRPGPKSVVGVPDLPAPPGF